MLTRLALLLATAPALASAADFPRDQRLDEGWEFQRAAPGESGESRPLDDRGYRTIELPHDWSIEDLPPLEIDTPEIDAVTGVWRFREGDDPAWSDPSFDDSDWHTASLPATWESHAGYTANNAFGWYRRTIDLAGLVDSSSENGKIILNLGRIDDADEAWLNGQRIGQTGSFPPDYRTEWNTERRYTVPASLVRGDGTDVLAVRVYDGSGDGGIHAAGVPHQRIGPFDTHLSVGQDKTGYTVGGTGLYRKTFLSPPEGTRAAVRFDGVLMIADVWINDHHLGMWPHGYTAFEFELTPHLAPPGEENTLVVRARNEGKNSRWYAGSGIYRPVWLTVTDPVHVPTWGVFVTTPEVTNQSAKTDISVEVRNGSDAPEIITVRTVITDPAGERAGESGTAVRVAPGTTETVSLTIPVASPSLWSPDSPALYTAETTLSVAGRETDEVATTFGIRTIEIDAERGMRLNGEPVLLKGGCIHHDNGPLGAMAIGRAEERRVELMKANGFNAVRSSHYPPSAAFLEACDRLGLMVIDEAFDQWNEHKLDNTEDYSRFFAEWHERDIASMVRRDRNHPSVIMWSIGNEIPEQFRAPDTQLALRNAVRSHDPTRPVTQAISTDWGEVIRNWDELSDPAFTHLDVAGYNYLPQHYEGDHARHPDRVMMGSESFPKDALLYWTAAEEHPYVIGDFVWTVMDYLGESGLAHTTRSDETDTFFKSWPWHNAWSGDLDLCGFKKPQSFSRDIVWDRRDIAMFARPPLPEGITETLSWWGWPTESPSWNWEDHEGEPITVAVYSSAEAVRLELNGKTIAEQPVDEMLTALFDVPYTPGTLRAIGLEDGRPVSSSELMTTRSPAAVRLTVDRDSIRADRDDLAYVTVEIVDAEGRRVPDAAVPVRFEAGGVGELAAQANGKPDAPASFRKPVCESFQGRCLAILRPTGAEGQIVLRASAPGLEPARIILRCEGD